jgi:hypothetical protein
MAGREWSVLVVTWSYIEFLCNSGVPAVTSISASEDPCKGALHASRIWRCGLLKPRQAAAELHVYLQAARFKAPLRLSFFTVPYSAQPLPSLQRALTTPAKRANRAAPSPCAAFVIRCTCSSELSRPPFNTCLRPSPSGGVLGTLTRSKLSHAHFSVIADDR